MGAGTYSIGAFDNHKVGDEFVVQEIAQLRTDFGLLTKQFTIVNTEKVNVVGSQSSTSTAYKFD